MFCMVIIVGCYCTGTAPNNNPHMFCMVIIVGCCYTTGRAGGAESARWRFGLRGGRHVRARSAGLALGRLGDDPEAVRARQ